MNAPIKLDIEVRNRGDEQVIIDKIDVDCACTVSELSEKTIEPAMSLKIPVKINTRGQAGAQSRRLAIFSNSKGQSPLTVDVTYSIKNYIEVNPSVLGLEVKGEDQNPTGEIDLKSLDNTPFQVTAVSAPDYLKYSMRNYDEKTSSCGVAFALIKPLDLGSHEGSIELKTTARGHSTVEIPTKVNIRESLTADFSSVYLGEIEKGKAASFTVLVSRFDLKPFHVTRVHASQAALQATYAEGESAAIPVNVTLTAAEAGTFSDSLEIEGDSTKREYLRLPVSATVK